MAEEPGAASPTNSRRSSFIGTGRDRLLMLVAWRARRSKSHPSPWFERLMLLIAVSVFLLTTIVAYRRFPALEHRVDWWLLGVVAMVVIPVAVALNGIEYAISARILGHRVPFLHAVRIGVMGTAANQLPIPGSAAVRIGALKRLGSSYLKASLSTGVVGLAWIGLTGVVAGVVLTAGGVAALGAVLLVGGIVAAAGSFLILRAQVPGPEGIALMARLAAVEVGFVALSAVRFLLVLRALGFKVSVVQAVALTVPVVVAAAAGFFPGGLGLRELLAAGISPRIGLPAAVGVLATATDRILALSMLSIASLVLLWPLSRHRKLEPSVSDSMTDQQATEPSPE